MSEQLIKSERFNFSEWFEKQKTGHKLIENETGYEQEWINYMWYGWIGAKASNKKDEIPEGYVHVDEVIQLCKDFSSRTGSIYIGDVESALSSINPQSDDPVACRDICISCREPISRPYETCKCGCENIPY